MKKCSTGKKERHQGLLELVFTWPIKDVINQNLYINKVNEISETFTSTADYLNSFKVPLIEETRADFCSGLESVGHAPACEISGIWLSKNYRPPKNLYYEISTKKISSDDVNNHGLHYEPESGDIFALTNLRPRSIADLIKPDKPLHFAYVSRSSEENEVKMEILSSEKIDRELIKAKNGRIFITYLMNITTNMRIWKALNPDPKSKNLGLIQKVLQYNSLVDDECVNCNSEESCNVMRSSDMFNCLGSFGLDESQKEAILSSISLRKCLHQEYKVKLIWGPPGTGKTKTVASLLFVILKQRCCRTLTCAPTNVAVIQVAKRLVTLFLESLTYHTYGLGDIVLFGNEKRMKIDDHYELVDVFLKYRVEILEECLKPLTGWRASLDSMMYLLSDPQARYNAYIAGDKETKIDKKAENGANVVATNVVKVDKERTTTTKKWKEIINKSMSENKKENRKKGKGKEQDGKTGDNEGDNEGTKTEVMTFEDFQRNKFCSIADRLVFCAENLYTHLPTSCLPLDVAKQMIRLVVLLSETLESARKKVCQFSKLLTKKRKEILPILEFLHLRYPIPKITGNIKDFCLDNAHLIFCTASGSIKMKSCVEMVVIDEAAQLKECESAISLQIPGVKTAILIGDDRQLPAMVQSEVLKKKINFGRSLFQRMVRLGKKKHLLNIQYRMHPSISSFPNRQFYENKIVDAPNVKEMSYVKNFLDKGMYGTYSFINVSGGKEDFKKGHSPRNLEEADVVDRIIAKLFKDFYCITKQKVSVGVISPYKGQVGLLQEKLEKKYTKHKENFCINIRSVDGFQGGEEDIIIISTVRCNGNGSVGFLSNCQRTNVALTRARYCLWIVGSGSTLGNSTSVWNSLVFDAKTRGCFYDVKDDIDLIKATPAGKTDFFGYLKLEKARWKVVFSNDFKISILSIKSVATQKRVKELLHKIADGWRQSDSEKLVHAVTGYGAAYELLEQYKVADQLNLAWTVDIVKDNSHYTQVIKIWDVLPGFRIPNLAKNLSILFEKYTVDFMNSCKYKSFEGNLVVPMSWPLHSFHNSHLTADPADSSLLYQLSTMNLGNKNNQGETRPSVRKNIPVVWKQVQR